MTIRYLAERGQSLRRIAQVLGVTEGALPCHLRRRSEGTIDGRSRQLLLADGHAVSAFALLVAIMFADRGPLMFAEREPPMFAQWEPVMCADREPGPPIGEEARIPEARREAGRGR
jgi:hypothetical protein